jgi:hypothetical protein
VENAEIIKTSEIFDRVFKGFRECGWKDTDMPREDVTKHFTVWAMIIWDTAKAQQVLTEVMWTMLIT